MTQPEKIYQGPEGQASPAEPLMPPPTAQPQDYGLPIAPPVGANQQQPPPPQIPGPVITPSSVTYQPTMANQQPIVVNQIIPQATFQPTIKIKTAPAFMACPYCHNVITTVVNTQFNWLNCCFCYCFPMCWVIVNLINEKDFNCTNATHLCPQCGQVVYHYNAC